MSLHSIVLFSQLDITHRTTLVHKCPQFGLVIAFTNPLSALNGFSRPNLSEHEICSVNVVLQHARLARCAQQSAEEKVF
jgi:hypothetical protein